MVFAISIDSDEDDGVTCVFPSELSIFQRYWEDFHIHMYIILFHFILARVGGGGGSKINYRVDLSGLVKV